METLLGPNSIHLRSLLLTSSEVELMETTRIVGSVYPLTSSDFLGS